MEVRQPCPFTTILAVVVAATGCTTPQFVPGKDYAQESGPTFSCRSRWLTDTHGTSSSNPKRLPPVVEGEIGRLEVKVLEGSAATPPAAGRPVEVEGLDGESLVSPKNPHYLGKLGERRISLIAESVPLGQVAVALAEALGVNVVVEPAIVPVRVFMHAADTTVGQVIDMISDLGDLRATRCRWSYECPSEEAGLYFMSDATDRARRAGFEGFKPVKVRLITLPLPISSVEFATAYCALLVSERGEVAVVGQTVIIRDTLDALAGAEKLAASLQGLPPKPLADGDRKPVE